jgi:hypothetical protein
VTQIDPWETVTFLNIEQIVPDPDLRSRSFLNKCPHSLVIKSHHPFDPRYKSVVHIVCDAPDVLLSQYHPFATLEKDLVAVPNRHYRGFSSGASADGLWEGSNYCLVTHPLEKFRGHPYANRSLRGFLHELRPRLSLLWLAYVRLVSL